MHNHTKNSPKGLGIALISTTVIMILEFWGGIITNSLALLSDSGHMLSDVSSLFVSLLAFWAAKRPPSDSKPFGYHRFEVLAALFNGVTLLLIAASILYEAYQRTVHPQPVQSETMILIAFIGLLANLVSAWALMKESDVKTNINAHSAYLHVIGDAISSVGVIIAGLLIMHYSLYLADPIISGIVALIISRGAFNVVRESLHILMEGTPTSLNTNDLKTSLFEINGVIDVHHLRLWTITSGIYYLNCHLTIEANEPPQAVLNTTVQMLRDKFELTNITIQIEQAGYHCDV